jgi:hypothetical protein
MRWCSHSFLTTNDQQHPVVVRHHHTEFSIGMVPSHNLEVGGTYRILPKSIKVDPTVLVVALWIILMMQLPQPVVP